MKYGWTALLRREAWPLIAGDTLAFIVFAAIGRRDHHETLNIVSTIGTAGPFIVSWLLIAPWAGAFSLVRCGTIKGFLRNTAIAWLCTYPVALAVRAIVLQRGIPLGFALVTLVANALFLLGWRGLYALYTHRTALLPAA